MPLRSSTGVSSWFSSATSTVSQTADTSTEMFLQSFMSSASDQHSSGPSSTETETLPRSVYKELQPRNKNISRQQPNQRIKNKCDINKARGDWTIPVSKFLTGFRLQASASLSNAYR